jgi:hypothetical protein
VKAGTRLKVDYDEVAATMPRTIYPLFIRRDIGDDRTQFEKRDLDSKSEKKMTFNIVVASLCRLPTKAEELQVKVQLSTHPIADIKRPNLSFWDLSRLSSPNETEGLEWQFV